MGKSRVLVALVENKPGVLNRVASLFRRRGYNIESLTVGHTETTELSRMTIVVNVAKTSAYQVEQNLYKLVNVLKVDDVTDSAAVTRDLALIKVQVAPETRSDIMQIVNIFRAKVVDIAPDSMIVEVTGSEAKVDSMVELLRPIGILELVRTGLVAMERGVGSLGRTNTNGNNGRRSVPV